MIIGTHHHGFLIIITFSLSGAEAMAQGLLLQRTGVQFPEPTLTPSVTTLPDPTLS